MIELFERNEKTLGRRSSKGNQLKWENSGIWYKADYTGYEGLSEYVISHLLDKSSLGKDEFVLYDLEQIRFRSTVYNGVRSTDFLSDGWQLITLERLFQQNFGRSLNTALWSIHDDDALHECGLRFRFLTDSVEKITGLKGFAIYLNKLFTIDAFFLNEDRHTHNIAVLMDGKGSFRYCPIFDNGAGLLADTKMDYPLSEDVYTLMKQVKAKTANADFGIQLEASEKIAGSNLSFCFNMDNVLELLNAASMYSQEERRRVELILRDQMRKYHYLFSPDLNASAR